MTIAGPLAIDPPPFGIIFAKEACHRHRGLVFSARAPEGERHEHFGNTRTNGGNGAAEPGPRPGEPRQSVRGMRGVRASRAGGDHHAHDSARLSQAPPIRPPSCRGGGGDHTYLPGTRPAGRGGIGPGRPPLGGPTERCTPETPPTPTCGSGPLPVARSLPFSCIFWKPEPSTAWCRPPRRPSRPMRTGR